MLSSLSERVAHVVVAAGFLSQYLSGPLPYVQHHITINVLSMLLNKTFLSFISLKVFMKLITGHTDGVRY